MSATRLGGSSTFWRTREFVGLWHLADVQDVGAMSAIEIRPETICSNELFSS